MSTLAIDEIVAMVIRERSSGNFEHSGDSDGDIGYEYADTCVTNIEKIVKESRSRARAKAHVA